MALLPSDDPVSVIRILEHVDGFLCDVVPIDQMIEVDYLAPERAPDQHHRNPRLLAGLDQGQYLE